MDTEEIRRLTAEIQHLNEVAEFTLCYFRDWFKHYLAETKKVLSK